MLPLSDGIFSLKNVVIIFLCTFVKWTKTQTCTDPPSIGNGQVTSIGPYSNGVAAVYTCQQGYSMNGDADGLVCRTTDNTWVGTRPQCYAAQSTADDVDDKAVWTLVALAVIIILLVTASLIFACVVCCQRKKEESLIHVNPYENNHQNAEYYGTRRGYQGDEIQRNSPDFHLHNSINYKGSSYP